MIAVFFNHKEPQRTTKKKPQREGKKYYCKNYKYKIAVNKIRHCKS